MIPNAPNPRYAKTAEMFERALESIPLASQTFSKSHLTYPEGQSPLFVTHASGSRIWDVDGNEYVDFISGLLPVLLGYTDPDVTVAVTEQLARGITFSLPTPLETEVAELLIELVPCAEKVRFGKNGSDATAAAIRIARAFTGRDHVAVCGYHGWQDWYIGSTARHKGVPDSVRALTHAFPFNDLRALDRLMSERAGEFACVIMEPMNAYVPAEGYLQGVLEIAHKHGALFILDEIITGFRYAVGGAQEYFGVTPDLACFGKGLANGFPLSAVVGRSDIMREMEDVFFSFTAGGEAISLAAAKATLEKIIREPVIDSLWRIGGEIIDGVQARIDRYALGDVVAVNGLAPWSLLAFSDCGKTTSWEVKTLFQQEMLGRGILIQSGHNISYAHSDDDVAALLNAYDEVLPMVADAVHNDLMGQFLKAPPLQPLFKVR
jgi:glutamate-1-semialdehyde 2,1-aminomutase